MRTIVLADDGVIISGMAAAARMLRYARRSAGLTQRQLAACAGVAQETIARIESGAVDPRVETLDRLLAGSGWGLEVEPRLGVGVDRTLIRPLLALDPAERLARAAEGDRNLLHLRAAARRR